MTDFIALSRCLICGSQDLVNYMDFGDQPLANNFHDGSYEQLSYPLGLNYCPKCWHNQQIGFVDPDILYKNYPYVSGTTQTLREYFSSFADQVMVKFGRGPLRVLDIASNDGSLVHEFKRRGHIALGVEPAENLVAHARSRGIETVHGYWGLGLLSPHAQKFDVIVAMNVLGHVANPLDFLQTCRVHLAKGGRIYIQTSQAKMLVNGEFDTCYHEHISYFTISSFLVLAAESGLRISRVSHIPIHGTSYLVEMMDGSDPDQSVFTIPLGAWENDVGLYKPETYDLFRGKANEVMSAARATVEQCREAGYRIIGYGAAAKGVTFLNCSGIQLDAIIDENPLKIGKLTPGGDIPVISLDELPKDDERSLFVILAWNFKSEIMAKLRKIAPSDSKYMTCFPTFSIE